jgi:hypothetical protein
MHHVDRADPATTDAQANIGSAKERDGNAPLRRGRRPHGLMPLRLLRLHAPQQEGGGGAAGAA